MRRVLGNILLGLAGFLGIIAVLLMVYAPGKVKVTPLNIDSSTRLTGTAAALPSGAKGPIKALNRTVVDSAASTDEVVVFDTFTCLIQAPADGPECVDGKDPQKRLITASSDRFATDRSTALAVEDGSEFGADGGHKGLINKLPFDAEQTTYAYWDGLLGRTVDLAFDGEEEIEGLNTYRYTIDIPATKAEISKGIPGTYQDQKTIWFDPATGSPIKQEEHQVRSLPDGTKVLDITLAYTDEQVSKNVADAKANGSKLGLISKGPLFAGILALLALVGGVFALMGASRRDDDEDRASDRYDDDHTLLDGLTDGPTRRDLHS
jgi:hypothetical protein